jgi:hypothetical protein
MQTWDKIVGIAFAAVAVLIATWMVGSYFELNKGEWASWVQAIGSIAAIAGAFAIANRQIRAASEEAKASIVRMAERRREAIKVIVEHAEGEAAAIEKLVLPIAGTSDENPIRLIGYSFKETASSLAAIPYHELDSANEVSALLGLRTALREAYDLIETGKPSEIHLRDAFRRIALFADRYYAAFEQIRGK